MENVMFVALLCYCLLITAGTDGQLTGSVEIENCNNEFIDIQENANNTIQCKGFNGRDTIVWSFQGTGEMKPRTVATCDPSNCTVHLPDHFAVERSLSHSTLFYQQYDTELDNVAKITCESYFGESKLCTLNVINQAKLSSCTVEEDRESRTVKGRCRFEHAYSYWRYFSCTWYQETDGQSRPFRGKIEYDSGSLGPSGVCTFTSTDLDSDPGTVRYSIDFYPGPGHITVNVGTKESSTSNKKTSSSIATIVSGSVGVVVIVVAVVIVGVKIKLRDKSYATPTRRPRNAEPEHVYNDLHNDTPTPPTTTTTTTPSDSIVTTTGDLHNSTNQHRGQGNNLDNVHHNENQPGDESSGMQQHPTYAIDHPETSQGYVDAYSDSNPYYSEIKDTGFN